MTKMDVFFQKYGTRTASVLIRHLCICRPSLETEGMAQEVADNLQAALEEAYPSLERPSWDTEKRRT